MYNKRDEKNQLEHSEQVWKICPAFCAIEELKQFVYSQQTIDSDHSVHYSNFRYEIEKVCWEDR